MKLLTKRTDYAIRALVVLAKYPDQYISVRQISEEQKIPYAFLRKILRTLITEGGQVVSKEGSSGGYKIAKDAGSIPVVEIIKLFQGHVQLSECLFRGKLCHDVDTCVLRKNIQRIENLVEKEFHGIFIADLLRA